MSIHETLEHFQDRDKAKGAFDALLEQELDYILVYHGFSGYGKTTLRLWLEHKKCRVNDIAYALVDFDIPTSYEMLLTGLLRDIKDKLPSGIYNRYRQQRDQIMQDLAQRVEAIHATQTLTDGENNTAHINMNLADAMQKAEEFARNRLITLWLDCLEDYPAQPLVFFFDTFEKYEKGEHWLWQTLVEAHKRVRGLRIVIGTRQNITSPPQGTIQIELDPFVTADSEALLVSLGVTSASYRQAVYDKLAQGHPGVTKFAADLWKTSQARGEILEGDDIEPVGNIPDAVEWIQSKIIERLEEPLKSAVRWMPLLRRFNQDILNAVLPENVDFGNDDGEFEQLTAYTFVRQNGAYWMCHDLLRGVQIPRQ